MWCLEDMKILVGSDLPVFSTGNNPCFSLRLCETSKPINVITGLDYWLDNLMCNVPEVLMCYHIDGMVQKYEIFKTEDLPTLSDECRFAPHVVKDFATNILSFLRSNATKEGHTYWLLKEPDLDVVKLYDLTSLCEDFMDSVSDNPFSLPLAVLLCRLSYTILERPDSTLDQIAHVPGLLDSCSKLIDVKRYPWLHSVVNYLRFIAATKKSLVENSDSQEEAKNMECFGSLTDVSPKNRSLLNLEYIANGLKFLSQGSTASSNALSNVLKLTRNIPVSGNSDQQRAMVCKLMRGAVCCYLHISAMDFDSLVSPKDKSTTVNGECLCLTTRRHLRLARNCYLAMMKKSNNKQNDPSLKSGILQLIGDLHFICEEGHENCILEEKIHSVPEEVHDLASIDAIITNSCNEVLNNASNIEDFVSVFIGNFEDKAIKWPKWNDPVEKVESAIQIYQEAFEGSDNKASLVRRMANACVEFANAIITRSLEIFQEDDGSNELEELWKKAYFYFDKAANLFETVRPVDNNNLAVVESNRARLMRVCAYCQPKQSVHYLNEAAKRYSIALKHLDSTQSQQLTSRIHWDLSTVHLTIADELSSKDDGNDEKLRQILRHLQEASNEVQNAAVPNSQIREAEINFREGQVRKKMLLNQGNDPKAVQNYLKLIEKSFDKCFLVYMEHEQWNSVANVLEAVCDIFQNSKVGLVLPRKVLSMKIGLNIRRVLLGLTKIPNPNGIQLETRRRISEVVCNAVKQFITCSGHVTHTEAVDACDKLTQVFSKDPVDSTNFHAQAKYLDAFVTQIIQKSSSSS